MMHRSRQTLPNCVIQTPSSFFKYKIITTGIYYRGIPFLKPNGYQQPNQDAVVALIGFEYKDLAFGYSYDLILSKLAVN